jgi:hypothetical protein
MLGLLQLGSGGRILITTFKSAPSGRQTSPLPGLARNVPIDMKGKQILMEDYPIMKKLFIMLSALAVAVALAVPVSAAPKKHSKKEAASTTATTEAHAKHAKKKGATKGKKEGQKEQAPGKTK